MQIPANSATSTGMTPKLAYVHRYGSIQFEDDGANHGGTAFPINYEELYNLKGRLLTLIDATFTDAEQRKAQKDLVWQALRAWMDDIESRGGYQLAPDNIVGQSLGSLSEATA